MKTYELTQDRDLKQHHFVLCYDAERKLWYHEIELEDDKFQHGTIFNEQTGAWSSGYLGDGEYETGVEDCAIKIHNILAVLNEQEQA
jgi:hypothetical protein